MQLHSVVPTNRYCSKPNLCAMSLLTLPTKVFGQSFHTPSYATIFIYDCPHLVWSPSMTIALISLLIYHGVESTIILCSWHHRIRCNSAARSRGCYTISAMRIHPTGECSWQRLTSPTASTTWVSHCYRPQNWLWCYPPMTLNRFFSPSPWHCPWGGLNPPPRLLCHHRNGSRPRELAHAPPLCATTLPGPAHRSLPLTPPCPLRAGPALHIIYSPFASQLH